MSFLSSPPQPTPIPVPGSLLYNTGLSFNTLNCSTSIGIGTADIATGKSVVAGVETLMYDSIGPGALFYLVYWQQGADAQNVSIRIEGDDGVDLFPIMTGAAPGVADRGGTIWSDGYLPFKRLRIYLTTQFIDGNAVIAIQGRLSRVSA